MADISYRVVIDAPARKAKEAVSTASGWSKWWSETDEEDGKFIIYFEKNQVTSEFKPLGEEGLIFD